MADLNILRPEVQQALAWLKSGVRPGTRSFDGWSVIRVELLRLADECATLKAQSIYPRAQFLLNLADANERTEKAETELTLAHRERDRLFLDAREWATRFGEMEASAERAEAELAALKNENAQLRDVLADRDMDREMAAHANKELAALKARMKPCAQVVGGEVRALMNPEDEGKYVAVVVVEE